MNPASGSDRVDSDNDPHRRLRDDVHLLGEVLGETLRAREGDALYALVEQVRALAKRAHAGDHGAFGQLTQTLSELPVNAAMPVARAFAHFLMLANIAEQHHRTRRRRDYARHRSDRSQPGSCAEAFARLREGGWSRDALTRAVAGLQIELVLTAHPTEIVRRTLLQAQRRIADVLSMRDRSDLTPDEEATSMESLRREIAIVWQTDEERHRDVTVLDEVRGGLAAFEQTLWEALPLFARQVDQALGEPLPLDVAPIRFGSWIGGDRDGNPNVTPETTRKAAWMARWVAADLYARDIDALRSELSLTTASEELQSAVAGADEPYRSLLRGTATRLRATRAFAASQIEDAGAQSRSSDGSEPYFEVEDLSAPLLLCHRSLVATGNTRIAGGRLFDVLRRVAAFGLTLAPLDIRQAAARHTEAFDWIARVHGLGAYADADEADRVALLVRELSKDSHRVSASPLNLADASDRVRDVIETFRMAAALPAGSAGAYVITMASRPSDVLVVQLLQRIAGDARRQRVVPLFETAADLARAPETLEALFAIPWYRTRIAGHQEVMIGYSDSTKDAGRFAAAWALYQAQEQVASVCSSHAVALTLFHGRGGSVGRGGGPTHLAIRSQPPGSVKGRLRVTEQGEMIQAKFGLIDIAVRTLEVYTTATLEATLAPPAPPRPEWRSTMDTLAERSRSSYRAMVYEHPQFLEYFRTATPEPELRLVRMGSRPARRAAGSEVTGLRAIPWQFAWTQTRLLLASWLGAEDALDAERAAIDPELLKRMYADWPFFQSTIDLLEMVLAKADDRIAAEYDRRLVPPALQPLGIELRERLERVTAAVLALSGHRQLLETTPVLRRSIDVRNPYVDPINLVQIELLARLRKSPDVGALERAFVVTVNGIAAGMRNTG